MRLMTVKPQEIGLYAAAPWLRKGPWIWGLRRLLCQRVELLCRLLKCKLR